MASVRLDAMLKEFLPKVKLSSDAPSIEGILVDLETRFPRLRFKLRDETGKVRPYVRVFVNGEEIEGLKGLATPVGSADSVDILHSIQGG